MTTTVLDEIFANILIFIQQHGWRIVFSLLFIYILREYILKAITESQWYRSIVKDSRKELLDKHKEQIRSRQQSKFQ